MDFPGGIEIWACKSQMTIPNKLTPDTLTVGTARRLPEASVWGYDVLDLANALGCQTARGSPVANLP